MLTRNEHIAEARSCLQTAEWLGSAGKRWQASEILWSAVKHSVSAVAILTEQEYGKYQHKRAVVRRLATETGNSDLTEYLKVAMQIHADSDKGFLSEVELLAKQREVRYFIRRLLTIAAANHTPEQPN